jgi:hypothetical protein
VSREWDAYGKMIEVLNHCLAQVSVLVYKRDFQTPNISSVTLCPHIAGLMQNTQPCWCWHS